MKSRYSIIIPLYNKANYIAKTLYSVLNQTFTDFEVVIVNDGSTDKSIEVVEAINDDRIKTFTTKNQGASAARNFGIEKAKSEFIAFLDADDIWEETFLETINKLILSFPDEQVYASALKIRTPKKIYLPPYINLNLKEGDVSKLNYFKSSIGHSILHCANSVFSKKSIENIGLFDESLITSEDTDYWIRTGFKYDIVFINLPLATHLQVENGLSKTNKNKFKSIDFEKYTQPSEKHPESKPFLNKNIYSSIIKYKLLGDNKNSKTLKKILDFNYLSTKQKLVITLPNLVLKTVVYFYNLLNTQKSYY